MKEDDRAQVLHKMLNASIFGWPPGECENAHKILNTIVNENNYREEYIKFLLGQYTKEEFKAIAVQYAEPFEASRDQVRKAYSKGEKIMSDDHAKDCTCSTCVGIRFIMDESFGDPKNPEPTIAEKFASEVPPCNDICSLPDAPDPEVPVDKIVEFRKEVEHLINRNSLENGSDTPDFILAEYLTSCLAAFDAAVRRRSEWYGIETKTEGNRLSVKIK